MANPASTGTYAFSMSGADLTLECLDRLQIRGPAITIDHLRSVATTFNLVQSRWTNRGVNLWEIGELSVPLIQGVATYTLDPTIVFLAPESFLRYIVGQSNTDSILFPLSRGDFAAISDKAQQGRPTTYWFNRQITPAVTFWPTPDATATYEFHYWRARQQQDMNAQMSTLPDIPFRFYEAFAAEVTAHMAMKWRPDMWQALSLYAKECWKESSDEDREKVSFYLTPDFSGYF